MDYVYGLHVLFTPNCYFCYPLMIQSNHGWWSSIRFVCFYTIILSNQWPPCIQDYTSICNGKSMHWLTSSCSTIVVSPTMIAHRICYNHITSNPIPTYSQPICGKAARAATRLLRMLLLNQSTHKSRSVPRQTIHRPHTWRTLRVSSYINIRYNKLGFFPWSCFPWIAGTEP